MNKRVWQSKTIWVNIIMAITAFFPPVQAYLVAHPDIFTMIFVGVNMVLRLITKDGIQITD